MIKELVASFVVISMLFFSGCATGSHIVTGTKRTAIAKENVKIYLEAPERYEVIGLVTASSDAGITEQGSQNYAVEELKKQAAKIGANGVLLTNVGEKTTTVVGTYGSGFMTGTTSSAKTISGQAILVEELRRF